MHTIFIGGLAATGSTTAARRVAHQLGYDYLSAGEVFRALASDAGQTPHEFLAGRDPSIDRAVAASLLARTRDRACVVESRTLPWLAPPAVPRFSVWLTCDPTERARRIQARDNPPNPSALIAYRDRTELARYRDELGIDISDFTVHHCVVDTTALNADATADAVIDRIRCHTGLST